MLELLQPGLRQFCRTTRRTPVRTRHRRNGIHVATQLDREAKKFLEGTTSKDNRQINGGHTRSNGAHTIAKFASDPLRRHPGTGLEQVACIPQSLYEFRRIDDMAQPIHDATRHRTMIRQCRPHRYQHGALATQRMGMGDCGRCIGGRNQVFVAAIDDKQPHGRSAHRATVYVGAVTID